MDIDKKAKQNEKGGGIVDTTKLRAEKWLEECSVDRGNAPESTPPFPLPPDR